MTFLPRLLEGTARMVRLTLAAAVLVLLCLGLVEAVAAADPSARPAGANPSAPPLGLPSPGASLSASASSTCVTCHTAIDNTQHDITKKWNDSVHGKSGIGCESCHGGDPTSDEVTVAMSKAAGFVGVPDRTTTVKVCGTCHSDVERMRQYRIPTDQLAKYEASVHGQQLQKGDTRVAICTDCHGVHDVKKASDPTAPVYPLNVPATCASCHSDAKLMEPYGIPTNQYDTYKASVHGQALLVNGDLRAPTCASCHGSHDAKPPQSSEVVDVCGKCHTATQALYEQSKHARLDVGPKCWTCHGTHGVVRPDETRFFHPTSPDIDCSTCHNTTDRTLILNADRFTKDEDRRCDTCHHDGSILYSQAQGIHNALDEANTAYKLAGDRIAEAAGAGMIVSDADVTLSQAKTSLIQGRAAVHTTKLSTVAALSDAAKAKAVEAQAFADAKIGESNSRRQAMVVVLAIILVNVLALYLLRHNLHRGKSKV